MATDVDTILKRQARMESERSNFERLWSDIGRLMLPRQADFLTSGSFNERMFQGRSRTEKVFDETAQLALDHGVSVFEGEVIPQGGQWQGLYCDVEELMNNLRVRQWFERKTNQLFSLRNSPRSGFANQTHESIASLFAFGTQGMWPDILRDATGRALGLSYRSEHIGQVYFDEDHRGVVDIIHRKFTLTHRQALQKWRNNPPAAAVKGERDKKLDESAAYLHVIEPNRDYEPGRGDAKGKAIYSCYIEVRGKERFDEGGYRVMPMIVSRYEKSPTETYGRSPAMSCLPAVRATQRMMADLVTAIEFAARPALAAHDDLLDQVVRYSPGGITFGALDDRGNPMIRQLFENADIASAKELLDETRDVINRAFFVDLYMAREEVKSHVSATEIMQREAEKGVLLSPLKRQEHEWFTPMAERELDLMAEMGLMADMPPELEEAGGAYIIRYDNPLNRARQANEAAGFYQMTAQMTPLMQLDKSGELAKQFFQKYPAAKVLAGLGRIHGVPASWEASEDEQAASEQATEDQQQLDQVLEAGDRASVIAKNLGQSGLNDAA
jgi:hypothetical protein